MIRAANLQTATVAVCVGSMVIVATPHGADMENSEPFRSFPCPQELQIQTVWSSRHCHDSESFGVLHSERFGVFIPVQSFESKRFGVFREAQDALPPVCLVKIMAICGGEKQHSVNALKNADVGIFLECGGSIEKRRIRFF